MKRILTLLPRELVHGAGGHLQSLSALAIVFVAAFFLDAPIDFEMLFAPFLIFEAIYLFDRYRDLKIDSETNVIRTAHIKRYVDAIPSAIPVLLVSAGALLLPNSINAFIAGAIVAALGLLYPSFFKKLTRKIPMFKNFYVAAVFAALAFFPAVYHNLVIETIDFFILLVAYVFMQTLIVQIMLDTKDQLSDRAQELKTLPVLLGKKGTHTVLLVLIVVSFAFALINPNFDVLLYLVLASATFDLIAWWKIYHGQKRGLVVATSKFLIWPLLVVIL